MSAPEQLDLSEYLEEREAMRRAGNRERVHRLLSDRKWHTAEELLRVGGLRFGARVHEIRHDPEANGGRAPRILSWLRGGESLYRWTCDCQREEFCAACRAAFDEMGRAAAGEKGAA